MHTTRDALNISGTLHPHRKPRLHQGNMLPVAGSMLPVSQQHVSLCIQQQRGNKLTTILLSATCCRATCSPGVNAALCSHRSLGNRDVGESPQCI